LQKPVPLRAAFGVRIEKADRSSYLATLERLPKHTTMKPGYPLVSRPAFRRAAIALNHLSNGWLYLFLTFLLTILQGWAA
jgi:hypothetical protein